MASRDKTSRQALLERGWYVVTDVETVFLGLSGKAHDLLILLKHYHGKSDEDFPTQERLADILKCSVRTLQRTFDELRAKGALSSRRTGRASQHNVTYVLGTVAELRILLGKEIQIPRDLTLADTTTVGVSEPTGSDVLPYIEEVPREVTTSSPLRGEGAAAASQDEIRLEDDMPWNRVEEPDELDPARQLGLWRSQEATDGATDDLDALFPAEEVSQSLTDRQKPARSRKQLDTPYALAAEFARMLKDQPWAGPAPVAQAPLTRHLKTWLADGLTPDQIRAMMRAFIADDTLHRPGYVPWKSLVNLRAKLLVIAERRQQAEAMETTRHTPAAAEHFLGAELAARRTVVDEETVRQDIEAWNAA